MAILWFCPNAAPPLASIVQLLKKNKLEVNSMNVFQVMKFKRELLTKYVSDADERKVLGKHQTLLEKKIRPVGTTLPVELIFTNGLIIILLAMIARFGLSFADETGKARAK